MSLKAARTQGELTVIKMARALEIGKDRYLKWEKHPSLVPAVYQPKISEVTGVPLNLIFFGN